MFINNQDTLSYYDQPIQHAVFLDKMLHTSLAWKLFWSDGNLSQDDQ